MNTLSGEWASLLLAAARTVAVPRAGLDAACLLTDLCARLPGVDEAVVLLPDDSGRGVPLAGTDSQLFDDFLAFRADEDLFSAAKTGQGPETDGTSTVYADLAQQTSRWPGLAHVAAVHAVTTVHTVAMEAFGTVVGSVVLASREHRTLSASEIDAVRGCASIAAAGMLADVVADSLPDTALRLTRYTAQQDQIAVWQATGMLAASRGVGLPAAEAMLREHARERAQPLADSAAHVVDHGPDAADEFAEPGGDPRVLVVDPDRFAVRCLADVLHAAGFEVTATTSAAAARAAHTAPPPVAIVDQTAAGAADLIRILAEEPGTQVIVISPMAVRQAPPATARVLPKPVHPSQILAAVRDLHPAAGKRVA
ncbi:hypothetical protein [Amycolatopsis silviterrae]|uniref:Response regulatory domain-containing protein n=1 Tax=Amycolatopsis silviterrae TaxID=1656914 RepID=A0ABW5HJG5_9PSEU